MIELRDDRLVLTSPATHASARMAIEFQRTLRIPDDGVDHPLPAGLGRFPLRHVEDHAVPDEWARRGGVMLPMHQSEALWIRFDGQGYPWAVKVSAGKVCAVTGTPFSHELHGGTPHRRTDGGRTDGGGADEQDYVVVPDQRWIDGFSVEKGIIRQFVAMPLGSGYSAEEQLTGKAEWGGIQIVAHPMRAERWEQLRASREARMAALESSAEVLGAAPPAPMAAAAAPAMGLGAGGRMRQVIHADPHGLDAWDTSQRIRCFVHLCNSQMWRQYTGQQPPTTPPTATEYQQAGLPWFALYEEAEGSAGGGGILTRLKSVVGLSEEKGDAAIPDNASVTPPAVTVIPSPDQVSDGDF